MTTRAGIVTIALAEDGYHDNLGYDEVNKYAEYFGIGYGIAYCDIFVAWCYEQAGIPLPDMHQAGVAIKSGAQYCPDSWAYAVANGAARDGSWLAYPGDQVIFNWNGAGSPLGGSSHTEVVETWHDGWLYTIGGNSGPSNVDGYTGTGGVHRHAWACPAGVGNSLIEGVIDTSRLVTFTNPDEEFTVDAAATARFDELDKRVDANSQQLVTVIEGVPAGKENPYGLVGIKDLKKQLDAQGAALNAIASHLGVTL